MSHCGVVIIGPGISVEPRRGTRCTHCVQRTVAHVVDEVEVAALVLIKEIGPTAPHDVQGRTRVRDGQSATTPQHITEIDSETSTLHIVMNGTICASSAALLSRP